MLNELHNHASKPFPEKKTDFLKDKPGDWDSNINGVPALHLTKFSLREIK